MRAPHTQATSGLALSLILTITIVGCAPQSDQGPDLRTTDDGSSGRAKPDGHEAEYLVVWAGDADEKDSDFMAVIDARRSQPSYGEVVATLPVGERATMPHHTEYEYPSGNVVFANGWKAGQTFLIDLHDPLRPELLAQFASAKGFNYPHSFARLPNGNVVATFQGHDGAYEPPGGLVELTPEGAAIRASSAATPDIETELTWPYSLAVVPELDRIVSTSADMGMAPFKEWEYHDTNHIQIWSISDLSLKASVPLPESGVGSHHIAPNEPRVLADGTVYVITFTCGLYRVDGIETDNPTATFVHAFPGGEVPEECFVPVVYGDYWIQTVPALPGLIVLDVSDPDHPVEVSRLTLEDRYPMPHWLAADRASGRLAVTGDGASWVLIVNIDGETGTLSIDEDFRGRDSEYPGIDFDRPNWPHGETGKAVVHGALFRTG